MNQHSFLILLIQIFCSLVIVQFLFLLFKYIRAPRFFVEILAGVVIGPSFLKLIWPEAYNFVFTSNHEANTAFLAFQDIGLILLMFSAGTEINFKNSKLKFLLISGLVGVLIPLTASYVLARNIDLSILQGKNSSLEEIELFFAIACSITSIPVLTRIFKDLNLLHTDFAKSVLSIALIEDLLLYIILGFSALSVTKKKTNILENLIGNYNAYISMAIHILMVVAIIYLCLKVVPKILYKFKDVSFIRASFSNYLTLSFLILLVMTILAILSGVPVFLGAFLAGIIIGQTPIQGTGNLHHIQNFSMGTFVPMYFVGVGLRLDLIHHFELKLLLAFLLISSFLKIAGVIISSLLSNVSIRDSVLYSVALNTRGGPGIVLASTGLTSGLINEMFFVILVLSAIGTSWFSSVYINILKKKIN